MRNTWETFLADLERYSLITGYSKLTCFLMLQGPKANLIYRIGHWLRTLNRANPIIKALILIHFFFSRIVEITTGISIESHAEIGPGLYIGHFGGIIVGTDVRMGENCSIHQGVTLGAGGRGMQQQSPIIGDRVFIAPGAKVFGGITIGDDVAIGANAVVTRSLEDRAVAVGIPAKVISYQGSFEFVPYPGMEHDAARVKSLDLAESPPED